ncbi:MAG TPA: deoxyribonuclease IV [Halanaerobiales bacterium]|nr:deoxyribonuclease IV [Halanaerobiales bacterium]
MRIGKHVSISGGLDKAVIRAKEINCNTLQIFVKNPRGWKLRKISEEEINKTKDNIKNMGMNPLVVHSSYLINLASPKKKLWEKSLNVLIKEYIRASKIGAQYLVLHPGNHTGSGIKNGIKKLYEGLNKLLEETNDNGPMILLENVAGAGTAIGSKFEELYDIITGVNNNDKIGVCFDTCHAFAAGYNIKNKKYLNKALDDFDKKIGLNKLKIIHINDSKHECSSKKDEHAHIGEGKIGKDGFELIINHNLLKDIPFILETPQFEGKDKDVEILWDLKN